MLETVLGEIAVFTIPVSHPCFLPHFLSILISCWAVAPDVGWEVPVQEIPDRFFNLGYDIELEYQGYFFLTKAAFKNIVVYQFTADDWVVTTDRVLGSLFLPF